MWATILQWKVNCVLPREEGALPGRNREHPVDPARAEGNPRLYPEKTPTTALAQVTYQRPIAARVPPDSITNAPLETGGQRSLRAAGVPADGAGPSKGTRNL